MGGGDSDDGDGRRSKKIALLFCVHPVQDDFYLEVVARELRTLNKIKQTALSPNLLLAMVPQPGMIMASISPSLVFRVTL